MMAERGLAVDHSTIARWLLTYAPVLNERIPRCAFTAPFVGVVEIVFGTLILVGLVTRMSAIPLLIGISVAIATTNSDIDLGDNRAARIGHGANDGGRGLAPRGDG